MSLDIIEAVAGLPALKGWDGLGMAVQAYGKSGRPTVAWADALGAATGRRIAVRLVKGAYWDSEIKHTQEQGPHRLSPVHPQGGDRRLLSRLRARTCSAAKNIYPAFATHNALTVATMLEWAGEQPRLRVPAAARHGRGALRESGPRAGLPYPHLRAGRRPSRPARLSRPPAARERRQFQLRPPARRREADRRGHPRRSGREDRGGRRHAPSRRSRCRRTCSRPSARTARGSTSTTGPSSSGSPRRSPRRSMFDAGAERRRPSEAGRRGAAGLRGLVGRRVEERAAVPRAARRPARARPRHADADRRAGGEEDHPRRARRSARGGRFLPLLCRPGARAASSRSSCPGRPASATSSGWRGAAPGSASRPGTSRSPSSSARSSAALAAGNSVVAKPASQTPEIAAYAVGLAHAAGVPEDALVLAAAGREMGQKLMEDVRIAGVAFTGSTATAKTHRPHPDRRRRPADHPVDRRDRRDQRDDRRFHRSARAGGAGRRHLGLPLGRPALLGAAPARAAGGGRRADAGDAGRARWTR